MDIDQLADSSATAINKAFDSFRSGFKEITRRSKSRFEQRDWIGVHQDATERLDLYKKVIDAVVANIRNILGDNTQNKNVWMKIKRRYSELIIRRNDFELAETFLNSVTRKIFAIVGVDPDIEYVDSDFETALLPPLTPIHRSYSPNGSIKDLVKSILIDFQFSVEYQKLELDAQLVADRLTSELLSGEKSAKIDAIEVIESIFYRNKGAYIIGRIRQGAHITPFVLPLLNKETGIVVDAVLLSQNEVSIVFSFTRSYFHVEVERPHELVDFLKSIMPLKPVAEIYISLGYNKHGKTELYRDLLHYLDKSDDKFEIARGKRGMVMVVFTLPSYDVVFKIIKDKPAYPKTSTRQDVIDKYNLVFMHDRAGRLVDAQEYEHLKFDKSRFSDELLQELIEFAANTVTVIGDSVIIKHLYTERKLSPLNLYVKEASEQAAREAVIDYGNAIKDIIAANLFPGDILLKNFGVTRHGRVVFYDYDEICLLTDCNFRAIPPPRNFNEELDPEPWFYVGEADIFPEEFKAFLELDGALRELFLKMHGDLFGVDFWLNTQERIKAHEVADIFPYRQSSRLKIDDSALQIA